VVVRLSGKQEMQGVIPFVPFCCHSITLLLSHNTIVYFPDPNSVYLHVLEKEKVKQLFTHEK